MAEAVISSIAEKLVDLLGSQAIETVGKIRGVKREFQQLEDTVSLLRLVLEDAEEQSHHKPPIKDWVEKLKDALYDAQDVYEEFDIEAKRQELRGHNKIMKKVRTFFSSSNQFAFKLKMSDKVRAVRERIKVLSKAGKVFHLEERLVDLRVERQWRKRAETYSYICEGGIKGRDEDKQRVKKFLLDSNVEENVSVLTIVGIGGLGKTALAQYVYNDEIVNKQFDLKMWVCVSDDFDVIKIVKSIIACANKKEPTQGLMELLQSELREKLKEKRYLLVLDDVWDIEREAWLSLRNLLVGGAKGSKILITTRFHLDAKVPHIASSLHMGGLQENASCDLLMQMAGRKIEEMQDSDMIDIVREIVEKCSGVPLIIRTVGSLLFYKRTKLEWIHFKDDELQEVSLREDNIIPVLRLSYDHLPSHLKQCFALCSLFPKDCELKKQTSVDLWLAEGFIQPLNGSQHLEGIAHGYFMDLLYSNFFQDYQEDEETCKMHDLMHDLACSVAGIECQLIGDGTKSIDERTRRISIGNHSISQLKAKRLRTFLSSMPQKRSKADLDHLIKSFQRLRILDLQDSYVEKVPRSIGKLKYLTYLDFSENDKLKRLPNSITRLQNLQTLNLRDCYSLEELPRDIRKLVSLRNLDIDGCEKLSYMPQGMGQLTSLHRLTRFILPKDKSLAKNCCRLGELKELNHIRGSLCIENLGSVIDAIAESKEANLAGKQYLETLELIWGDLDTGDAITANSDKAILDGLKPHPNLQKLTIRGYKGESFPKWMTALPNLLKLRLLKCTELDSSNDGGGNVISNFHDGLKSLRSVDFDVLPKMASLPRWLLQANNLQHLKISDCESLRELPERMEALQDLYICNCHSLTSLPKGIRALASLTSVHITHCAELDSSKDESGDIISDFHDGLSSLRSVHFSYLPKLASLPWWLLQANNLQRLWIEKCDSLKELPEQIEALQELFIFSCPSLTSLPEGIRTLASLTSLRIFGCVELDLSKDERGIISDFHGFKSLRFVTFNHLPKLASLPRWLLQANNLQHLSISDCQNMKELPEQIEALQSLQELFIFDCHSLASLPEGMRRLASLTSLCISGCVELDLSKDESNIISDFHGLKSLRSVRFEGLPKLASLPRWLLQANNLQDLKISSCENLKELPERIEAFQSLQKLDINHCPLLTLLPEGMRRLTSLASLRIYSCPELEKRCKKNAGEDWHKIAHILHVSHQRY